MNAHPGPATAPLGPALLGVTSLVATWLATASWGASASGDWGFALVAPFASLGAAPAVTIAVRLTWLAAAVASAWAAAKAERRAATLGSTLVASGVWLLAASLAIQQLVSLGLLWWA